MNPDQSLLTKMEGRIQNVTAKGIDTDCTGMNQRERLLPSIPVTFIPYINLLQGC